MKKLREFSTTKPALHQMLKELLRQETQEKKRPTENKLKTIKKTVIGLYITIIMLRVNRFKCTSHEDWLGK